MIFLQADSGFFNKLLKLCNLTYTFTMQRCSFSGEPSKEKGDWQRSSLTVWRPANRSYWTRCVSQGGASNLLFGLSLQPERFTVSDVPGRSQASVATVSVETRLSRAERRDKTSTSSSDSPSGEYIGLSITHFFWQSENEECSKLRIYR